MNNDGNVVDTIAQFAEFIANFIKMIKELIDSLMGKKTPDDSSSQQV